MALTTQLEALSLATHDFSFSLYKEFAKTEDVNIFYSPFSIHVIMFMASIGAVSNTFDELIKTIHLNENTYSLGAYGHLLEKLSENDNLKLATGMFVNTAFNVNESFVENSKKYLKSSIEKLNFMKNAEKQRRYLNNWVLNKTNNKIKNLFSKDSITQSTIFEWANALHFKSDWEEKFKYARDDSFYVTPSNIVTVKMMHLVDNFQYYHDSDLKFAALSLPFKDFSFIMMILLPDDKDGLKDLENNLSKIKLFEIANKMSMYRVTVELPRFKLEQSLNLKHTLSDLGCPTMFTAKANFSNIIKGGNLYLTEVVHKAYIDVNENGVEAAAATRPIPMFVSAPIPLPNVDFHANHPFVMAIVSANTGAVLFQGRLSKP